MNMIDSDDKLFKYPIDSFSRGTLCVFLLWSKASKIWGRVGIIIEWNEISIASIA